MKKQLHIKKGQESSRLSVLREFFPMMKEMFETINNPPRGFFDDGHISVGKGNYKVTLIVEEELTIEKMEELTIDQKINMKTLKGKTIFFKDLPNDLLQTNSYGVPGSDWVEPKHLDPNDKYHKYLLERYSDFPMEKACGLWKDYLTPRIGVVCTGREWINIKGYKEPVFAPGRSWVDEVIPEVIETLFSEVF